MAEFLYNMEIYGTNMGSINDKIMISHNSANTREKDMKIESQIHLNIFHTGNGYFIKCCVIIEERH